MRTPPSLSLSLIIMLLVWYLFTGNCVRNHFNQFLHGKFSKNDQISYCYCSLKDDQLLSFRNETQPTHTECFLYSQSIHHPFYTYIKEYSINNNIPVREASYKALPMYLHWTHISGLFSSWTRIFSSSLCVIIRYNLLSCTDKKKIRNNYIRILRQE